MQQIFDSMKNFSRMSLLERVLMQAFSFRFMDEADKVHFEKDFWHFAEAESGQIKMEKFVELFQANDPRMSREQVERIFKAMDNKKQQGLLFSNFMAPLMPMTGSIRKEESLKSFFHYLD